MGRSILTSTDKINFKEYFYYDDTSPTYLRRKTEWRTGEDGCFLRESVGAIAGSVNGLGTYNLVYCCGKRFQAHRVIWEMLVGPLESSDKIDHKNGNGFDNSLDNLRKVGDDLNARNAKLRSDSSTGVVGVSFATSVQRSGNLTFAYVAHCCDLKTKKRKSRSFGISKHGNDEAFRLACEYREAMIAELNEQGAGYTHDHGKR